MVTREQLEQAIAAQETQRAILGDAVVDTTLAALRKELAALDGTPEQRKLVTILFADTVSSTAMAEGLDPEDVLEIMDGALGLYVDAVQSHGGVVARLMGDGVLAFFGAPVWQEDDPFRALRAALAIVAATQSYATEVEARWGLPAFGVRVGINTGLVALGEVGSQGGSEWTAMGDAINLAARLQHAAPAGGILISHDTHIHVRGLFEMRTLEPIKLRGRSEAVQVYLVEREKPRTFRQSARGVEGVVTPMIGRDGELQQMQDLFRWVMEEQETQIVTIVGDPGVGKSRLLREFDNWLDELPNAVVYFTGRSTVEMSRQPYALMRNMFAFRFDIQDSDSAATVRDKLERGITGFLGGGSARKAHLIANLIGYDFAGSPHLQGDDPQQLVQLGIHYLVEFFEKIAVPNPTVIFLDDIHWADDKSLALVQHLVRARPALKLLVVCLTRPTLFESRVLPWASYATLHTLIELQPLSPGDSAALVREILRHVRDLPAELVERIADTAEGNPYYVEEIIKMLIDDGVIIKDQAAWAVLPDRLTDLRIPATLTGVIQARLDALPGDERQVLQRASVVGRIFWDEAVASLQSEGEPALNALGERLVALQKRELVRWRERSVFDGAQEYIFRHNLLHDVTYESVLRRLRRVYHAQVAAWLEARCGDRLREYTGLIAEHYERAGQADKAVTFLGQAAEIALDISAYHEAIGWVQRALPLLDEDDARTAVQLGKLKWMLGRAHRGLSDYPTARQLFEESLQLLLKAEDADGLVRILYELGWLLGTTQRHYDEAERYFNWSLTIAQETQDRQGIAWAYNGLGSISHSRGDLTEALRYYQQSLTIAQEIGDHKRMAGAQNNIGLVQIEMGRAAEAQRNLEEALERFRAIGNRAGVTSPLLNLGELYRRSGKLTEARQMMEEARALAEEIGDRSHTAIALVSLGSQARIQGEYGQARRCYGQALAIAEAIAAEANDPALISTIQGEIAIVARLEGRYDEARTLLETVLDRVQQLENGGEIANVLIDLSHVARLEGRLDDASMMAKRGVMLAMEQGNRRVLAKGHQALGELALALDHPEESAQQYRDALALYTELNNRRGVTLATLGLGSTLAAQGDLATSEAYLSEAYALATELRDTPFVLMTVVAQADAAARANEVERSAELLGLALNHKATPQEARTRAYEVLGRLGPRRLPTALVRAFEVGKERAEELFTSA